MATYFEAGIGSATQGDPYEMGRSAALEALSQVMNFEPSLCLIFVAPHLNIKEIHRGVNETVKDCPIIGTSTAGEIDNGFISDGVVVNILASQHLKVHVGLGQNVTSDYKKAVKDALSDAGVSEYFNYEHPLHQTLHMAASGAPVVSPVLLILFTPGHTSTRLSYSHKIHTTLRQASANRIPIIGGSSGDYFRYKTNYQIVNDCIAEDAIALAFIESEILFGLGLAHGFNPTTKRALVTSASGHILYELDNRPAAEVYAEFLGVPIAKLMEEMAEGPMPRRRVPFGSIDVYGNSILHVPERIIKDGSIIMTQPAKNHQVINFMEGPEDNVARGGFNAFEKAIKYGGLKKPSSSLMFSCALRIVSEIEQKEIAYLKQKTDVPFCGFYTLGEKGIFDDGLPVYTNLSVSMLVFSDELNPVASLIQEGKSVYYEFTSQLKRKVSQLKSINKINQVLQDAVDVKQLLSDLAKELAPLFPWADGALYLSTEIPEAYSFVAATDPDEFPGKIDANRKLSGYIVIKMESNGKNFGVLVLKHKDDIISLEEEDIILAETIGKLTANGLYRIELDSRTEIRLQQLEILTQIGHELSKPISLNSHSQNMVQKIREVLGLSFASLWLIDRTHRLLIKEVMDHESDLKLNEIDVSNDELLTTWQIENQHPYIFTGPIQNKCPVNFKEPFPYTFVSLPIIYKDQIRGILNLYSKHGYKWLMQQERTFENKEFLQSISTQLAIFIENKSLHKHATFNKEIHHRVKNNLQNIASLLRMQIRRLNRVSPEQALEDSISRIMSIALVHETLSQSEIGMIDIGQLVGRIIKLIEQDAVKSPEITLDLSGLTVLIPSREATALALVVNELVLNAIEHGLGEGAGKKIVLKVEMIDEDICITIQDFGPGIPEDFDVEQDGNLGLTIVNTLVKDDLKGVFDIKNRNGAIASVRFPQPKDYYEMR